MQLFHFLLSLFYTEIKSLFSSVHQTSFPRNFVYFLEQRWTFKCFFQKQWLTFCAMSTFVVQCPDNWLISCFSEVPLYFVTLTAITDFTPRVVHRGWRPLGWIIIIIYFPHSERGVQTFHRWFATFCAWWAGVPLSLRLKEIFLVQPGNTWDIQQNHLLISLRENSVFSFKWGTNLNVADICYLITVI